MADIPLANALLLWNSEITDSPPAFAVRPLGHDDYYRYDFQVGACMQEWRDMAAREHPALLAKAMAEIWGIVAFYKVPVDMVHRGMLVVPEYRAILADDCLPKEFRHERF